MYSNRAQYYKIFGWRAVEEAHPVFHVHYIRYSIMCPPIAYFEIQKFVLFFFTTLSSDVSVLRTPKSAFVRLFCSWLAHFETDFPRLTYWYYTRANTAHTSKYLYTSFFIPPPITSPAGWPKNIIISLYKNYRFMNISYPLRHACIGIATHTRGGKGVALEYMIIIICGVIQRAGNSMCCDGRNELPQRRIVK